MTKRRITIEDLTGDVVETTESRVCYFGYTMNNRMANAFVKTNG